MSEAEPTPEESQADAGQQAASGFRRLAMIVLSGIGVLLLFAGGTIFVLYRSATAAVPEYEAIVAIDPATAETERREFESQLAALVSDTQALPEWKSRVTARQINAWLATRLERDFPGFTKAGLLSPRVMLKEGEIVLAARSVLTRIHGVVTMRLRPLVTEADELALEIASARIGNFPLPLDALMGQLKETPLVEVGPIRLAQVGDSAAVIVDVERIDTGRDRTIRLTGVNVRPGQLLLRGETLQPESAESAESAESTSTPRKINGLTRRPSEGR